MTAAEVAARCLVSVSTVQRWADDGRLPSLRSDRNLFDGDDVDKIAAELAAELTAKAELLARSAT
jgi:excisionase family DNA binding protein